MEEAICSGVFITCREDTGNFWSAIRVMVMVDTNNEEKVEDYILSARENVI